MAKSRKQNGFSLIIGIIVAVVVLAMITGGVWYYIKKQNKAGDIISKKAGDTITIKGNVNSFNNFNLGVITEDNKNKLVMSISDKIIIKKSDGLQASFNDIKLGGVVNVLGYITLPAPGGSGNDIVATEITVYDQGNENDYLPEPEITYIRPDVFITPISECGKTYNIYRSVDIFVGWQRIGRFTSKCVGNGGRDSFIDSIFPKNVEALYYKYSLLDAGGKEIGFSKINGIGSAYERYDMQFVVRP